MANQNSRKAASAPSRRPSPTIFNTKPVTECGPLAPGTRIILTHEALWSVDREITLVAGPNGSGWEVEADYRPSGLIVLRGTTPLGDVLTWYPNPADVRAEV